MASTHLFYQKLTIPTLAHDLLDRSRIFHIINQAVTNKEIVFVVAPAGYGKTSALVAWAKQWQGRSPVSWYSLGASDSEPLIFLRHLLAALSSHYPALSNIVLELDADDTISSWQSIAEQMIALMSAAPLAAVVIVDDAHLLADAQPKAIQPIMGVLEMLISLTPVRLILASRMELPGMTRLIVQGRSKLVDTTALKLTPQDVERLALLRYGTMLPPGMAAELVEWASGWCAAVMLALENWHRRGPDASPGLSEALQHISSSQLYPFLSEQVFAPLPEPLQRFLLATSVLHELNAERCDALRQSFDSATFLAAIQARDLFIFSRGEWLRYHDLFRGFLLARLYEHPQQARQLLRRSAELYQQWGLYDLAFERWLQLGEIDAAVDLVLQVSPRLREWGEQALIQGWLAALQARAPLSPALLLLQARVAADMGVWVTASAAIQLVLNSHQPRAIAEARILEVAIACLRREDERASEMMALIAVDELPADLQAEGYETAGRVALNRGWIGEAIPLLKQAIEVYHQQSLQNDGKPPAHLYDLLGMAFAMNGDFSAALYFMQQAYSIWKFLDAPVRCINTLNNLATLATEEGRLSDAQAHLNEALRLAQHYDRQSNQVLLLCSLGDVTLLEVQLDQALSYYTKASELARRIGLSAEYAYAAVSALRAAILARNDTQCAHWQRIRDQLPTSAATAHAGLVALVRALEHDDPQQALHYLAEAEASPYLAIHDQALLLLLRAQILYRQGGWRAAAPAWQAFEMFAPRRHLDPLLQLQARITPDLLIDAAEYPLARRWQPATRAPASVEERWTFQALGQFVLCLNDEDRSAAVRPLEQLVIIRLLEAGPAGIAVTTLWEDVWGDVPYSSNALRQSFSRIRRATGLSIQLRQSHCHLLLPWRAVTYDVAQFEGRLAATDSDQQAATALEEQIKRYQGSFLGRLRQESQWLEKRRTALHRRVLWLREKLAERVEQTDPQRALQIYTAVLEEDLGREIAAAGAMRCSIALGDRALAIRIYQQVCGWLMDGLGTEPSPLLEQLYRSAA